MMENKLDGNAAGGILQEIFPFEMTLVEAICTGCGATNAIGALAVYMHGMGTVLRCPSCESALIRVAQAKGRYWLDMRGVRVLQIGTEAWSLLLVSLFGTSFTGGRTMHVAQSGIFALGTGSHSYLEFDLHAQGDPLTLVQVMADLGEPRMTTGGVNLVVGFRPSLWARVALEDAPEGVMDFDQDVRGVDGYTMPATQHDLWLWVAGHAYHTVFDVAREAMAALAPVAQLAAEVAGWTYKESRDLTGFIDGTENPSLSEAPEVALIPDGSPGTGGSVVLVQQWMHDAAAFEALPLEKQEQVIGRTKQTSTELAEEVRGAESHVSRTVIEVNGVEQHIFRRNTPFGTATAHGTMFIGFSCDQQRLTRMLDRMAGVEDGIRDALTRYTTAVSGAYYFVPSIEALRRFASASDE